MKLIIRKKALVSGASIAGIATAYWLNKLGYAVTVVELAPGPRIGGAAINVQGMALDATKRMGIFEQLLAHRLQVEKWEFKNADGTTARSMEVPVDSAPLSPDAVEEIEIEREELTDILLNLVRGEVELLFNNRVTALHETPDALLATFQDGAPRSFDLMFGCDGAHSGIRNLWFGHEAEYSHFLEHYFSLTIVPRLLLPAGSAQLYNVPGKVVMLNAYKQKTDIAFAFFSAKEIPYDYRDTQQQQRIIAEQFAGLGWRTPELLDELQRADTLYFDKFCQIRMPSWTKGRVALVGDAGYCASPAAGMGASLALAGAAAVADALAQHDGNFELAFQAYNHALRPFIEQVQVMALDTLSTKLIPKTEQAILDRNSQEIIF